MRKYDWADTLARQVAADFGADLADRHQLELVAARLRLCRQEGIGIGLDQARDALNKAKEKRAEEESR